MGDGAPHLAWLAPDLARPLEGGVLLGGKADPGHRANGVGHLEDAVQVADRLELFELGDHRHALVVPSDLLLAHDDVFRPAHKGEGEVVHIELHRELEVMDVLVRERGEREWASRNADALAVAEQAAPNY